jgi:ankyrin repeat protein
MSVPNLNSIQPSTAPVPVGQQQPADTPSAPLPVPVMVQKEKEDAGDASGKGFKRGRPQDSADDAFETSTEPVFKKRREIVIEASNSNFAALIEAGDLEAARAMLERAPELLDAENLSHQAKLTPLCLAAQLGKEDVVAWLITMKAKVDTPAGNGSTALMFAAQEGHTGVLQQLISYGANVNAIKLNAVNAGNTAVHFAATGNKKNALLILLRSGASVDHPNKLGVTPLLDACKVGSLEIVQLLQEWKANLSARTSNGITALYAAVKANHLPVVRWLLEQGVFVDEASNTGQTPFLVACYLGQLEIVQLLRQSGANLSVRTNEGRTPLMYAANENRLSVVRWLLAQGVDINAAADDGSTPFNLAFHNNHVDIAELLLDHGANAELLPNNGNFIEGSILFAAATRKKYDMLELLLYKRPASQATLASLISALGSEDKIAKELIQYFLRINTSETELPID